MEGQTSDSLNEQQCLKKKLTEMLQNVEPPEMSIFHEQCIYRVPAYIRETNPKAYTPQIVSIGPLHKSRDAGKQDDIFESMEELKVNYLKAFLNRSQVPVGTFVDTLQNLEDNIRRCYAVRIKYNSHDFLKMILIDACFIIELFLRWIRRQDWHGQDPVMLKEWMQTQIQLDLILLENQIPFFVLEQLYDLAGMSLKFPSFLEISLECLNFEGYGTCCLRKSPKHFTDLLRTSIISSSKFDLKPQEKCKKIKHVYSASQLWEAGLKFEALEVGSPNQQFEAGSPSQQYSFLDLIDFNKNKGVLKMPILNIHDSTEMFFRNLVAFERCHLPYTTNIINQYLVLLDFLINTEKDVNKLVEKRIIVNSMVDANAVATAVNSLSSNILMPDLNPHFYTLCNNLNKFYENRRNKYKANFIHEYFNTPWKIASTFAAIVLLVLTFIQTIYSII